MQVILDIEANSLSKPTKIWLIVIKELSTGNNRIFRNVTDDPTPFLTYTQGITKYIGHNFLGYDYPVLHQLLGLDVPDIWLRSIDTLVLSKLVDYSRPKHSISYYGEIFGLPKIEFNDWTKWSQEMEDYCVRDVDINHKVWLHLRNIIDDPKWSRSIALEQEFQYKVVNNLHDNGFYFSVSRAETIRAKVEAELKELDDKILTSFPPKCRLVKEVTPRITKYGTLHKSDFRWVKDGDLRDYNGGPFCRIDYVDFNPSSHKQIIEVLNQAGWKPVDKTKTHLDTERAYRQNKSLDLKNKLDIMLTSGWRVNEENLSTLPPSAPAPARLLAKRILLESRRRTLVEWLGLCQEDNRIHGKFYGIGAWTHRMAHQQPNTANIPNEYDTQGQKKLLGKELRSLWCAPKKRLLVGVDAEGIQLRIFAHYIDDKEFTKSLVEGKKEDKSDPHSLNQRILGSVCKSRAAAKRFIYALLLGAGVGKLQAILECSKPEAEDALNRLMERYQGFTYLKQTIIPRDGRRGYFEGLDGRKVPIPGETARDRSHLAMSGYLQNGEAVIMKMASLKWIDKLRGYNSFLVNFVHDEWQTETPCNVDVALEIAKLQADSLRQVGEELKLKCPLAGSYWNDDHKDYTIGTNWSVTH